MGQVSLPQHADDDERRKREHELERRKREYRYDATSLAPFVISSEVPVNERYSVKYHAAMIESLAFVGQNLAGGPHVPPEHQFEHPREYAALYSLLPRPEMVIQNYWRDWVFSEQRLAGPNPMVLRRLRGADELAALREKVALGDEHLRIAVGAVAERGLEAAVDAGRLFVADYEMLEGLPSGTWSEGRKYLCAPIAVFLWRSTGQGDRGELVPVAIQLGQTRDSLLFTPEHEEWRVAKVFVQVADANHHEMVSHLAYTHVAMEPFSIAAARHLPYDHPIQRLLKPHFQFLIARNTEARCRLLKPDGPVDNLLAGTLEGSLQLARRGRTGYGSTAPWGLRSYGFKAHLESRGLWDRDVLPHFPYRDDGFLVWSAIQTFVRAYVEVYYPTPADLAADHEVQAWARELSAPPSEGGGGVPQMPDAFHTLDELIDVLREVIFNSSAQHAATNFPQYEFMTFVANMPLAAYHPPPDRLHSGRFGEGYLRRVLPPAGQAISQLLVMHQLASYRHDRLGDYTEFEHGLEAIPLIRAFQIELRDLEEQIRRRNDGRRMAYPFLQPSKIPNSTSV